MNPVRPDQTYGRRKIRPPMPYNFEPMFNTSPLRDTGRTDLFETKHRMSLLPINEDQTLETFKPAPNISTSTRSWSSLQGSKMKTTDSDSTVETVDSEETYLSSCMTLPSGVSIFLNQLQSNTMTTSSIDTLQKDSTSGLDSSATENMRNADATHDIDIEGFVETKVFDKPEADFNVAQSTMINVSCAPSAINLGLPEDISEIYDYKASRKKCSTAVRKTSLLSNKKKSLIQTKTVLKETSAHISSSFAGKKVYRLSNPSALKRHSVSSRVFLKKTATSVLINSIDTVTIQHTPKPTCSKERGELNKSNSPVPNDSICSTKHVSSVQPIACAFPTEEVTPQCSQAPLANVLSPRKTSTPEKSIHKVALQLDLSPVAQKSLSELEPNLTMGIVNSDEIAPDSPLSTSSNCEQEASSSRELCCIVNQTFATKTMGRLKRYHAHGGPSDPSSMPRDILSEY